MCHRSVPRAVAPGLNEDFWLIASIYSRFPQQGHRVAKLWPNLACTDCVGEIGNRQGLVGVLPGAYLQAVVPEGFDLFRSIFPSFEKPVARAQFLNIQQERRSFRGIAAVLLIAAGCGIGIALWEPSSQVTSPLVSEGITAAPAPVAKVAETTAVANADDDQSTPTVKLSAFCSQRTSARRACANVKAFRDARLTAPEPAVAKPAATEAMASAETIASGVAEPASIMAPTPEEPVVQPQKPAAPKVVKRRPQETAPVERLVRVYDQVMPDGRVVPVYRRVGSNSLETGTIVGGEYRPSRRANLEAEARPFGWR